MSCADLLQDLGEDEEENDLELKNKKQIGGRKSGATVKELKTKEVLVPSFRVGDDGFSGERGGRRSGRGGRGGDRGDGGRGRGPLVATGPPTGTYPHQSGICSSFLCRAAAYADLMRPRYAMDSTVNLQHPCACH